MNIYITYKKNVAVALVFALIVSCLFIPAATALNLKNSYEILRDDYPDFINKLKQGGASDANIESFILDLDREAKSRGPINEDNFNSVMYAAFQNIIFEPMHRTFFRALIMEFGEEVEYTDTNKSLHPNLRPLRNAVEQSVLSNSDSGSGDNNQTNPVPPSPPPAPPVESTPPAPPNSGGTVIPPAPSDPGGTVIPPASNGNESTDGPKEKPEEPVSDKPPTTPKEEQLPPVKDVVPEIVQTVFRDIDTHWAKTNIQALVNLGAINGYPDGTFKPSDNISRGEFATVLVKALKLELPLSTENKVFNDTSSHWAKDAIAIAVHYGIVTGYDDGTFRPNALITREQMALMIVRAKNLDSLKGAKVFNDQDNISSWAKEAVNIVSANGLMSGYPDGSFLPRGNATRAEAVTVITKAL